MYLTNGNNSFCATCWETSSARPRPSVASLLAATRLHAGMALLTLGQTEKAIEHFRAARDADPNGKSGAIAIEKSHTVPCGAGC